VSTVNMELEDALTIFSYSSPYPVQLSLLPATADEFPVPRTPLERRSWSLDQLGCGRRQRAEHRDAVRPVRRASLGQSEAPRPRTDVNELIIIDYNKPSVTAVSDTATTSQSPHTATDLQPTVIHLPQSTTRGRPATRVDRLDLEVHAEHHVVQIPDDIDEREQEPRLLVEEQLTVHPHHLYESPPAGGRDENVPTISSTNIHDLSDNVNAIQTPTSIDEVTVASQPITIVTTSSTVDDKSAPTYVVVDETLTTSSPGVASAAVASTDEKHNRRTEESVTIVIDEDGDQKTLQYHKNCTPEGYSSSDEVTSPRASLVQQQQQEGRKADHTEPVEASGGPNNDGGQRVVVEPGSSSLFETVWTRQSTNGSEVFYDIDLSDNDHSNAQLTTEKPEREKKKKRSFIRSLKSLLRSSSSGSKRRSRKSSLMIGGAVPYTPFDEDVNQTSPPETQQQAMSCGDVENFNSVDHIRKSRSSEDVSDQHNARDTSQELLASATARTHDSTGQEHAEDIADSLHRGGANQLKFEEPGTEYGVCHKQQRLDQTEMEELELARLDTRNSLEDVSGTKLPVTDVADEWQNKVDVDLSNVDDDKVALHVITADNDELLVQDDEGLTVKNHQSNSQESEAQPANVHLTSTTFQTDEDRDITPCIHSDVVEIQDETIATTEPTIMKTETEDVSQPVQDDVTCDSREADFDTDATRSGVQSSSTARQDVVDIEQSRQRTATDEVDVCGRRLSSAESAEHGRLDSQRLINSDDGSSNSAVVEVTDPTISKSTPDLSEVDTAPEIPGDKCVLGDVTSEIPSVLSMMLNLHGVGDAASSGHCEVATETPTVTSGGTSLSPADDDLAGSGRDFTEMTGDEVCRDGMKREADVELTLVDREQNCHPSTRTDDDIIVTDSDDRVITHKTTVAALPPEHFLAVSGSDDETRMRLVDVEQKEAQKNILPREEDSSDNYRCVDRSEAVCVLPTATRVHVRNRTLVMGQNYSNPSGIVDSGRVHRTAERFPDTQAKRGDDPAETAVRGNEEESTDRTSSNRTFQQPHDFGVPVNRHNQLPINSSIGTAPTGPSASNFTFVVQRQVKVNNNRQRSLSTGSSNDSAKPAYTFVVPDGRRRRSASDYNNNNELSTTRRFSATRAVSDGRKFDIRKATTTISRHTVIDSSEYDSWQRVDSLVHHTVTSNRLPARTGSGNSADQERVGFRPAVNGRLSESVEELNATGPMSQQVCTSSPNVACVEDEEDGVASSLPGLMSTSPGLDDLCRSEPCLDVTTSFQGHDITKDDVVSQDLTRLRPAARHSGSVGPSRVSWPTSVWHDRSNAQLPANSRRRPRRRRTDNIYPSTSSTTHDVTPTTH